MSDYYDHHPLLTLTRPVALIGPVTDDTRAVAHRLAALGGLPYTDLDRLVEHHAGCSVWQLIREHGADRYRDLEREHLQRALADRPHGILSLGDGALLDRVNRRRVRRRADLIAFDYDAAACFWRLGHNPRAADQAWHPLHPEPLVHVEQITRFLEARRPTVRDAPRTITMNSGSPYHALSTLLGWFGLDRLASSETP